jgi:hypothetical protein
MKVSEPYRVGVKASDFNAVFTARADRWYHCAVLRVLREEETPNWAPLTHSQQEIRRELLPAAHLAGQNPPAVLPR